MSRGEFPFRSYGRGLYPTTDEGLEYVEDLGHEKDVMVKVWTHRNIRRHRRFWAILHEAAQHLHHDSAEMLLDDFKYANRMFTVHGAQGDKILTRPKSTNFMSMDEVHFKRMERRFFDWIFREYEFDVDELQHETDRKLASYGRGKE